MIFIDTSAFLAIVKPEDVNHLPAKQQWKNLLNANKTLYTNNYVVVESIAIIQKRSGLSAAQKLQDNILEFVNIDWINEEYHFQALETVFASNRRRLSLVDCSAFETMRRLEIEISFTFDRHFHEEGFNVIP